MLKHILERHIGGQFFFYIGMRAEMGNLSLRKYFFYDHGGFQYSNIFLCDLSDFGVKKSNMTSRQGLALFLNILFGLFYPCFCLLRALFSRVNGLRVLILSLKMFLTCSYFFFQFSASKLRTCSYFSKEFSGSYKRTSLIPYTLLLTQKHNKKENIKNNM